MEIRDQGTFNWHGFLGAEPGRFMARESGAVGLAVPLVSSGSGPGDG